MDTGTLTAILSLVGTILGTLGGIIVCLWLRNRFLLSITEFQTRSMKNMKNAIIKILTAKSICTLVLTIVFSILSLTDRIDSNQFLTIFTTVIAFYFGTQHEKSNKEDNKND